MPYRLPGEDTEARAEAAEIAAFAGQMGRSRRKGLAIGASVGVLAVLILLVGGLAIRQRSIRRASHDRQCGHVIIENGHEVVFAPDDCRDVHGNPIEEP